MLILLILCYSSFLRPADYLAFPYSSLTTKILKSFGFGSGKVQKNGVACCVI